MQMTGWKPIPRILCNTLARLPLGHSEDEPTLSSKHSLITGTRIMKRQIKTVVAVATLAWTASSTLTADACDRGGRRVSIGRSRIGTSLSHSPYRRYSPPVYRQPQPVYSQPQPVYSQPQPVYSQSQPVYSQPFQTAPAIGNRVVSTPVAGTRPATGTNLAVPTGRQVSAPPARPVSNPQNRGQVQQSNRPANTPAPTQRKAGGNGNPEASALQLLASITDSGDSDKADESNTQIPEFSASASSETSPHVGTWKVSLPGSQSVQLVLKGDSSFAWTATKNGKSSSFQGQYRLEEGRLTLVRSSDLQKMAGSWTGQGTGFTFKLDGATTAGLNFSRG
jgi:hypothetical protein